MFGTQFQVELRALVPLESDALGRGDDDEVAYLLHVKRGTRLGDYGLTLHQLNPVEIRGTCMTK